VVVDFKTSARKYTDPHVEASLQLSVYSYANAMNGLVDQEDFGSASTCYQDRAARALSILDAARPRRERPAVSARGRGAERNRGRRVPPEPGLAVQGLPVPKPVLGVAVNAVRCRRSYGVSPAPSSSRGGERDDGCDAEVEGVAR
jgi:hypothetical protein